MWFDDRYAMPSANGDIILCAIGLLESLRALNPIGELTRSMGNTKREYIGQGVANIVCGIFAGMGGCAMIGQSMINIGSGARSRRSSFRSVA